MNPNLRRYLGVAIALIILSYSLIRLRGVWPDDYARLLFGLYRPAYFYQTLVLLLAGGFLLYAGIFQPKTPFKRIFFALLPAFFIVFFTLFLVELVLANSSLGGRFVHDRALLIPHPQTLHAMRPNLVLDGQTPGDLVLPGEPPPGPVMKYRITTDSLGYRGWDGAHHRQVLYVGDSFTFAAHFPKSRLFPGVADHIAGVSGYNAGVPAIGPGQEALIAQDLIQRLKPKVLVWQLFTGNDLLDQATFLEFQSKSTLDQRLFNFKKGLVLPQAFKKLFFFSRKLKPPPSFSLKSGHRHRYLYTAGKFAPTGLEQADKNVRHLLRSTIHQWTGQGIKVLVVIFPPKLLAHYRQTQDLITQKDYQRGLALSQGWEEAAISSGGEVLNFVKEWSSGPYLPGNLYLPLDTHLNLPGHTLAGKRIGAVLKELLP